MSSDRHQSQKHWKYYRAKRIDAYLTNYPLIRNVLRRGFIAWQSRNNHRKIKGSNNTISIQESIIKNTCFDICGDRNRIEIGSQTMIENLTFYVRGSDHHISIGSNCRLTSGGSIWIEDEGCRLTIGDNTLMVQSDISLAESNSSVEIGQDCMLSYNIDIRSSDSHSIIDLATGERVNQPADIKIEDRVWIGAHAKILKGVTIAKNSVVGMGAIVTKDVPSNTVVAGIPAKTVKTNITWDSNRI